MEPKPLHSGAVFEVLGRRQDEHTEYLLTEVYSEVSKIAGDEMCGSGRDSPTENRPVLVAELNVAAQDVPELGIGAGLSDVELGLRLRYELAREFAPYVGINWERRVGDSARFARAAGEGASTTSLVMGLRFWF